ncbi:MAG: 16S rRNA (guanine(966)-N(2))-methyltransferase RsmD [Firmicutes bacterium]|nr:16S rRNA (guanine(966)-N(2))-methyltransferase RsmD [Bacillota bacterium]
MRIISGIAKGNKLTAPVGLTTRPTGDRMKEDLFNILISEMSTLKNIDFLDLFCGSGQIGIEALSRGAKTAVFVDDSKEAIKATKANLQKSKLNGIVLEMPVQAAFSTLKQQKFDVIFLDPPYKTNQVATAINYIVTANILKGILVAECPVNIKLPHFDGIQQYRTKTYKQTQFLFYKIC